MATELPPAVAELPAEEAARHGKPPAAAAPRCDVQVPAGGDHFAAAVANARTGDRLCLAAGDHMGGVSIDKSLVVIGTAGAAATRIVGNSRAAALRVDEDGLSVRIEGVTLSQGHAEAGGGLAVYGRGKVQVADCVFSANHAGQYGGGGLYARAGLLQVERTRFEGNDARQGGGVFLDQALRAELTRVTFEANRATHAGHLRVTEGVELTVKNSQFGGFEASDGVAVHVSGTRSRKPDVRLQFCEVASGALQNGADIPGAITLQNSKVPNTWKQVSGVVDAGGNTFRP